MKKTGIFTDSLLKEHDPGFDQIECPARITTLQSSVAVNCNNELFVLPECGKASRDILSLCHTEEYIKKIEATSGKIYSVLDDDTFASKKSYDAACIAAGATVKAVELLAEGAIENGFALVRPPGHHAEKNRAKGFCIFNNVAIAARHLLVHLGFQKILIVDWDVHHGNGTQNEFYDSDEVLFLSIHQSPAYPGTGSLEETGSGRGEGYTINVPFPGGQGDLEYANVFNTIVQPVATEFGPEIILVSAGFDGAMEDGISTMYLTHEGYGYMAYVLKQLADELCGGKILFVLEGGYNIDALQRGVFTVLSELVGKDLNTPFPATLKETTRENLQSMMASHPAIEMAREIAKRYWKL